MATTRRASGGSAHRHQGELGIGELLAQVQARSLAPEARYRGLRASAQGDVWLHLKKDGQPQERATGKYLFFSSDPQVLADIAVADLSEHGFHHAKLATRKSGSGELCLCLFASAGDRCGELAERGHPAKFRHWKSHEDTRAGRYS